MSILKNLERLMEGRDWGAKRYAQRQMEQVKKFERKMIDKYKDQIEDMEGQPGKISWRDILAKMSDVEKSILYDLESQIDSGQLD